MKKILLFTMIMIVLTACTGKPVQVGMPNPASVNCLQKGNRHEIRTAADGSQNGVCIFPDGSTCDEWAYFRGECKPTTMSKSTPSILAEPTLATSTNYPAEGASGGYMPPGTSEAVIGWSGVIKSTAKGAQFDDYFERHDLGQVITFGIDSMDPAIKVQIAALRDSGKVVHLYGTLLSNVPDYNGSQIQVERIEVEE